MDLFQQYSGYKTSVWQPYFQLCDSYYAGFHKKRNWPGTKDARSSIKLHVASDFVETLYSNLAYTLFFSGGEDFFDILGENPEASLKLTQRLRFIFHAPIDTSGRTSFWALKRGLRNILKYGIGFNAIKYSHDLNRPILTPISPYDIYWSSTTKEWIDDSPVIFQFTRSPLAEIEAFRNQPGYSLPTKKTLEDLATNNRNSIDPMMRAKQDAKQAMIGTDVGRSGDKMGAQLLDLIRVTTKGFSIKWLIPIADERSKGNSRIIFNGPNLLEFQPYVAATYRPLLDNLSGASPVGLLAGEHELQQTITNALLDAIDLAVTPPQEKGPGQQKKSEWKPGGEVEKTTDGNAGGASSIPDFPAVGMDAYHESRSRAMRTIGTNDMAISGRPTPSNANRTLGGVQSQSAAREERQFGPTEEIESMFIIPGILKLALADAIHSSSQSKVEGLGPRFEHTEIDTEVLKTRSHVQVRGATRMVGVSRLSSALRIIMQYLFNPAIQAEAAKAGYQLDFGQVNQLVNDSLGLDRKYRLYRRMSQQEGQQRQQAEQQQAQEKQAVEQQKAQSQQNLANIKARSAQALEQMKQAGLSEDRAIELLTKLAEIMQPPEPSVQK